MGTIDAVVPIRYERADNPKNCRKSWIKKSGSSSGKVT
jgi:hypothetical protein